MTSCPTRFGSTFSSSCFQYRMLSLLGRTAFRPAYQSAARIFASPLSSTPSHLRLSSLRAMTTKVRVGSVDLLNDGQMQVALSSCSLCIHALTVYPLPLDRSCTLGCSRHRACGVNRKEIPFPSEDSEAKILLSKVKGQYYATSSKCTHYGAPLAKGVLTAEGRLVWWVPS